MDAVCRPAHRSCRRVRRPRPLTERQLRKRMEAVRDEVEALGVAYQLTTGEIRWRLLLLERHLEETLDRWSPA
jgi:hypothetical protein